MRVRNSIGRVRPGQATLPAADWNLVAEAVEGTLAGGLQGQGGEVSALGVACTVVSDDGDTLTCTSLETGEALSVYKPPLLRPSVSARGGVTYTYTTNQRRTATSGSDTETQVVTEAYLVGDEIIARPHVIAGGVIVWMDTSARAWAKENT